MNNNDVLRRLRYTFRLGDNKMIEIFSHVGSSVTKEQLIGWHKKDDDPDYLECSGAKLALFLDGFIIEKRGRIENAPQNNDLSINNNIILRKLKIALELQAEDMLEILKSAEFIISKHELSAFFRRPDHQHYRICNDQLLRRFLKGLRLKYRVD
ncbi:MAG: DUF1456 family protein [Candidatus Cloacimonetes bacterium]|nr:DUF1456 family protein [Candidatus Cloacimonadota bacterium]